MTNSLLSIIINARDERRDLLHHTVDTLLSSLDYPHFELLVYNHKGCQGIAFKKLVEMAKGEFLLNCEEDWFFFYKNKNWVKMSIDILTSNPTIGMVRLREDGDGQTGSGPKRNAPGGFSIAGGEIVHSSGWTLNPFIAKTARIKDLVRAKGKELDACANPEHACKELFKDGVAKLALSGRGVVIHSGGDQTIRGRRSNHDY